MRAPQIALTTPVATATTPMIGKEGTGHRLEELTHGENPHGSKGRTDEEANDTIEEAWLPKRGRDIIPNVLQDAYPDRSSSPSRAPLAGVLGRRNTASAAWPVLWQQH